MRRIVEVASANRHLHAERGFLVIDDTASPGHEAGRVPLADIEALIAHGHGITLSTSVLARLADHAAPFVVVDSKHNATGMLLSCDGNTAQAARFDAQVAAGKPAMKRIWADIVRAKIRQQEAVLEAIGQSSLALRLRILSTEVRSGDASNIEAQAARHYWPGLFGPAFRRDRGGIEPNGFLNYGYTVLRATTARAVIAAGLHPTIGVHHRSDANPMRLVDDLVEPFRPFTDLQAWLLWQEGHSRLDREEKTRLVEVMAQDLETPRGTSPIGECIQVLATSVARVLLGEEPRITVPAAQIPAGIIDRDAR
jgi:CRISPR-associated protein Cas1